jgi:hypothetical protein
MSSNKISSHLEGSVFGNAVKNIHKQYYGLQNLNNHFKNKGIQTDYRESDCQTVPWEPQYQIAPGNDVKYKNLLLLVILLIISTSSYIYICKCVNHYLYIFRT